MTPTAQASPGLDTDQLAAWRLYRSVVLLVEDVLEQQLRTEAGMSHQFFSVLVVLSESEDRELRMTDIAAQLCVTRSRLSYTVQQLEARGWVTRVDNPGDARGQKVKLTDSGLDELVRVAPGHGRAVREAVFSRLSPEQVQQMYGIYEAILGGIEDGPVSQRLPWRR